VEVTAIMYRSKNITVMFYIVIITLVLTVPCTAETVNLIENSKFTVSPSVVFAETDNVFYYSNWEKGIFSLTENKNSPLPKGSKYTVSIKDKNGTLIKTECGIFKGKYTLEFDVSILKNIGEAYNIEYVLIIDNIAIAHGNKRVYRYNRPSYIREDNTFEVNGGKFFPVMGYHVQPSDYGYCVEAGINVIQYFPRSYDDSKILSSLNEMHNWGLMAFVALYGGLTEERIKYIVNLVKQHPAVFGYMLYDEPLGNRADMEELEKIYRLVRDNDTMHPTYIVEAQAFSSNYGMVAKYTDIFAVDPYPSNRSKAMYNTAKHVALAKEATHNKKPVMCINEIMTKSWRPTADDIRNMNYQALFSGADGIGYYDVRDVYGYNNGEYEHMWQRESYEGIVAFAKNEIAMAYEVFVLNKYKTKSINTEGDVWYKCVDTGAEIYCVVINKSLSAQTTKINLAVGANLYKCVINGTEPQNISNDGESVSVKLGGAAAVAFIIATE